MGYGLPVSEKKCGRIDPEEIGESHSGYGVSVEAQKGMGKKRSNMQSLCPNTLRRRKLTRSRLVVGGGKKERTPGILLNCHQQPKKYRKLLDNGEGIRAIKVPVEKIQHEGIVLAFGDRTTGLGIPSQMIGEG